MIGAHFIGSASAADVRNASVLARSVLATAATLCAKTAGADRDRARGSRLGRPARRQEDLLRLLSITGAIRTNVDVVPQSLREFVA